MNGTDVKTFAAHSAVDHTMETLSPAEAAVEPSKNQNARVATRGVIAAGHPLTAEAGATVLRDGGNAVDAAVAAISMACVCEPVLCSPGGGAFVLVRDGSDGSVHLLDAFVQTPLSRAPDLEDGVHEVHADFGTARQDFRIGPATAATPGLFDGLAATAERFGTLPLDRLVSGAPAAARAGVTVTPFQHHLSAVVAPILTATEDARSLFAPDGNLLPIGATFQNPGLADALEILSQGEFANSTVAAAVVEQQVGRGHLTADDLDHYSVEERTPYRIEVGDSQVHLNPLPAAGGVLIGHTLTRLDAASPLDLATAIAATGAARRDADGDLASLAALPQRNRGTTHVSVVDAGGTACSITVSNGEGNGEVVDGFGFMLNNVLGEDDVNPHHDDWPPDTRLSSMMCPTIVEGADGSVTALGSGGSRRIRSAISQVVAALCLNDMDLAAAVDAPRLHHDGSHLDLEAQFDDVVSAELRRVFPDHLIWPEPDLYFGGVHAARLRSDGTLVGHGDVRRGGASIVVED